MKIRGDQIKDGTITNTQIASGAAIALSKLAEAVIQADGGQAFTADQSMGNHKLTNVTDPASAQDAATKNYVDTKAQSISVLTNGDGTSPELVFDSNGDVIMTLS